MEDYSKLTVVKLKDELKARGLSTSGLKAALVARLEESDATADQEVPAEEDKATQESIADREQDAGSTETGSQAQNDIATAKDTNESEIEAAQEERGARKEAPDLAPTNDTSVLDNEQKETEAPQAPQQGNIEKDAGDNREESSVQADDAQPKEAPEPSKLEPAKDLPAESQILGTPIDERDSQRLEGVKAVETVQPGTQNSVGLEELAEDRRKRKRRSQSPIPSTQDAAFKRIKAQDGSPRAKVSEDTKSQTSADVPMNEAPPAPELDTEPAKPSPADARFKSLFATAPAPSQLEDQRDTSYEDRDISPAVHPATASIYIRNLQRPLQPNVLRDHLSFLSQSSVTDTPADSLVEFFLDGIRSHCIVQFSSTTAASRVRLALHDTVWPKERDRKPLWVDYIPEEKTKEFIETEQRSAGSKPPKRWEIAYEEHDGEVIASLREADLNAHRRPMGQLPKHNAAAPTSTKPAAPKGDPGRGFNALDDLFMSTSTKPKLYFQPVSASIADHRLNALARGTGGGRSNEMRRFTFEGDMIVDKGPEWGRQAERKGRGGFRGGAFEGRGGGFRGDSWRGGR